MDTSGYKGWWAMKFFEGKDALGVPQTSEGFKNVLTGEEVMPERGHNGEPPGPTGDLSHLRHSSAAYREGYDRIQWDRQTAVRTFGKA